MTCNKQATEWRQIPVQGPFFRPAEAAKYLGISMSSFYGWVSAGELPTPVKIGGRATGLPRSWLDAFLAEKVSAQADR